MIRTDSFTRLFICATRATVASLVLLVCSIWANSNASLLAYQVEKNVAPKATAADAIGESVFKNGDMESGELGKLPDHWRFVAANNKGGEKGTAGLTDDNPEQGKNACELSSKGLGAITNLLQTIDAKPFIGKRIRLRGAVRCELNYEQPKDDFPNAVTLWLRIQDTPSEKDAKPKVTFLDNTTGQSKTSHDWKHYEIVGDVKEGSDHIVFGGMLTGRGTCWIDDITLEIVDESVPLTVDYEKVVADRAEMTARMKAMWKRQKAIERPASGTYHLTGSREITFRKGVDDSELESDFLLSPLPLAYRDQVPISYEFIVEPESAIKSIEIYNDTLDNHVVKLVLKRVKDVEKIQVTFKSTVLVGPSDFQLPDKEFEIYDDDWPAETQPWLKSTWCVEADHKRFAVIGESIRNKTRNAIEVIDLVLVEARKIRAGTMGRVKNLTAIEALDAKGSCTSNANLVAALLRSANVPARVLSGYPSWSGPLQTHYIVEAYIPEFGWYPIESTMLRSPWPNSGQINVSIVPIEYESEKLAGRRIPNAGGVPYLSLTEQTGRSFFSRGNIEGARFCDHHCELAGELTADPNQWSLSIDHAKTQWNDWLKTQTKPGNRNLKFGDEGHLPNLKSIEDLDR